MLHIVFLVLLCPRLYQISAWGLLNPESSHFYRSGSGHILAGFVLRVFCAAFSCLVSEMAAHNKTFSICTFSKQASHHILPVSDRDNNSNAEINNTVLVRPHI